MALSNYERQKKWREKNRARYNLQRRNHRKNLSGGVVAHQSASSPPVEGAGVPFDSVIPAVSGAALPAQNFKDETLERLKGLIKIEEEKPRVEAPAIGVARFGTFRDDDGRPITEAAHKQLQKLKEKADGRYEIGDYNQA